MPPRDGVAGRLVAGDDEQVAEVEDLLLRQRFALQLRPVSTLMRSSRRAARRAVTSRPK